LLERTFRIQQAQIPSLKNSDEVISVQRDALLKSKFNYAWACCRSPHEEDIPQGILLLRGNMVHPFIVSMYLEKLFP
jgi:hypothetical protein